MLEEDCLFRRIEMTEFERHDAIRALRAMQGQRVAVLLEGPVSRASYLGAMHGILVGPDEDGDGRWMLDDGQEPQRYEGTWFAVPAELTARLSDGTVVLLHEYGQTTVTADEPLGVDLSKWRNQPR